MREGVAIGDRHHAQAGRCEVKVKQARAEVERSICLVVVADSGHDVREAGSISFQRLQ